MVIKTSINGRKFCNETLGKKNHNGMLLHLQTINKSDNKTDDLHREGSVGPFHAEPDFVD